MFRQKWVPLEQSHLCVYQAQVGFSIEHTKIFRWKIGCVCPHYVKSLYLSWKSYPPLIWKVAMASPALVLNPPPHCCLAHLTTSSVDRDLPRTPHQPWDKARLIDEVLPSLFHLSAHHFQTHSSCCSNTGFFSVSCLRHVASLLHSFTNTGTSVGNTAYPSRNTERILPASCSPTRPWTHLHLTLRQIWFCVFTWFCAKQQLSIKE